MKPEEFEFFSDLLRDRSGVSLDAGKEYLVEVRLEPLVGQTGLASLSDLFEALRDSRDKDLENQAVELMMTHETSFFRSGRPFEILSEFVIPTLLDVHASERKLRIWSAGCSHGQEPYSIAMVLKESHPELADWTIDLLGTDLSETALGRAREGSYSELEMRRGLPVALREKYFSKTGIRWQINDDIRSMVDFQNLNLIDANTSLPTANIVFMRNVLIYFGLDLQCQIMARLHDALSPSSYLFLGSSETTFDLDTRFDRVDEVTRSGCYRVKDD